MIAAFITAVVLILGITFIYLFDEKDFTVVVVLGLWALFIMGTLVGEDLPKSSKKKITPKIRVECEDNKCDTTYIYE